MARINNFKEGDKVIWFSGVNTGSRRPMIAWVVKGVFYPSSYGKFVRITRHPQDVDEGRGGVEHIQNVFHWTHELWSSCERWYDREAELMADLKGLSRGKVDGGKR